MGINIAFLTSENTAGGPEKSALQFIEWLCDDQHQTALYAPEGSELASVARERNISVFPFQRSGSYINLRLIRLLSGQMKKRSQGILFIIRPRDILLASVMKIFWYRGLKLIYFQQSFLWLRKHPVLYTFLFRPFDAWISPSRTLAEKALALSRYNPARMLIIPPCIDVDYFEKDTLTRKAARKILELPEGKKIIGILGSYHPKKRYDFFIRALQFLIRHDYHPELLIMGKPAQKPEEQEYLSFLKNLAVECKVENHVHFRNYNNNLVSFFRSLDIFTTNWIPQPFDVIIPKAMASGVPVIAPFSEVNTELLDNGNNGLLYHKNDLEEFSAKVIYLITQPMIAAHLVNNGKKVIRETYDKNKNCEIIHTLISKLN